MCFGTTQTGQVNTTGNSAAQSTGTSASNTAGTTTYNPNPTLASGALSNLGYSQNLMSGLPLQGVANFSPQQQASFDAAAMLLNGGVPYTGQAAGALSNFAGAATPQIGMQNIASLIPQFMNQYVGQALQPQIEGQNQQFAQQNQNLNSQATASGAFGDSRAGVQAANLTNQQDIARTGLLGQAYTSAFNTALGGASQQAALNQQGQTTNAQLQEQAIQNQLAAAAGYEGLGGYALSNEGNLINLNNVYGQQQTAQQQAALNALFQQQYGEPLGALTAGNQTLATGVGVIPAGVSTTGAQTGTTSGSQTATGTQQQSIYQPNNWGLSLLGSILGSTGGSNALFGSGIGSNSLFGGLFSSPVAGAGLISDERLKEDIHEIGEMADGQPLYSFRYKGDPSKRVHVGLMAQEVEQVEPDAVSELFPGGPKTVNYGRATWLARALAEAA